MSNRLFTELQSLYDFFYRAAYITSAVNHACRPILILITAVLYSAPSRKSTQKRSQPNLGQTMAYMTIMHRCDLNSP